MVYRRVGVAHCAGLVLSPFLVPTGRVGLEVIDHGGCQVTVGGDKVALNRAAVGPIVCARANESVVAQVPADVGGNDLSVDAVARDKVLILPG